MRALLLVFVAGCALDDPEGVVLDDPETLEEEFDEADEAPHLMIDFSGLVGHEIIIIEGTAVMIDTTPVRRGIDHIRQLQEAEALIVEDEIALE